MGTRHLIEVISDGELRVAQYGQWDGYPEGQGVDVLNFLRMNDLSKFREQLKKVSLYTAEEFSAIAEKVNNGTIPFPEELNRDTSAKIFEMIMNLGDNPAKLKDSHDFGYDSLFCEWAYVVDLDRNALEVYEGFVEDPSQQSERWHTDKKTNNSPDTSYYGVKFLIAFDILNLPTEEEFLKAIKELDHYDDEDEE